MIFGCIYVAFMACVHWFLAGRLNVYYKGETQFGENINILLLLIAVSFFSGILISIGAWLTRKSLLRVFFCFSFGILIYIVMVFHHPELDRDGTFIASDSYIHIIKFPIVCAIASLQVYILLGGRPRTR